MSGSGLLDQKSDLQAEAHTLREIGTSMPSSFSFLPSTVPLARESLPCWHASVEQTSPLSLRRSRLVQRSSSPVRKLFSFSSVMRWVCP